MNEKRYVIATNFLNKFKTKEFAKSSSDAIEKNTIELSKYIFKQLGLNPIPVNFDNLGSGYGSYSHFDLKDNDDFSIKYNSRFLVTEQKYANYRLLATIIHEVEHYRQEIQEPEKYLQTLKSPTVNVGFYINQHHEEDAHRFEIEMLKSMRDFFDDPEFDEFIELEEQEISGWYSEEKNQALKNGFVDNTYDDTLKEIVDTYSVYLEPINELLKCTSGRLNFVNRDIETKNIKGVIVETDNGWSCKLLTKDEPPIIIEFGLNKGVCKISRIYKSEKWRQIYISTTANEAEKFRILSYIPSIVKEYEMQTKQDINCLDICPYSIDDFADKYKDFLYHIYHKENILDKLLKRKTPENVKNIFEYNLKEDKNIIKEFRDAFDNKNTVNFSKRKDNISDIFDDRKLDDLMLSQSLEAAKADKDITINKSHIDNER